jgi:hypothetical protein
MMRGIIAALICLAAGAWSLHLGTVGSQANPANLTRLFGVIFFLGMGIFLFGVSIFDAIKDSRNNDS